MLGTAWFVAPASAQVGTPAGTPIVNIATATYSVDGATLATRSNTVTLRVAERLDVALARVDDTVTQITAVPVAIPVMLTNRGSGEEAFALTAVSSTPDVGVRGIAIDRDDDGRFDAGRDPMVDRATPPLAPGATVRLFAIVTATGDVASTGGEMTLSAQAVTGSGPAGTVFAGKASAAQAGQDGSGPDLVGQDGAAQDGAGDAVVGPTGAAASVVAAFAGLPPAPTLAKAQVVRAPDGGTDPVSGAVVTYTLTARFPATPVRAARIDDPLPSGTIYLPGTLSLDGRPLTDVDDGDAGRVADARVTVALGDVAPGAAHAVQFQIRLP